MSLSPQDEMLFRQQLAAAAQGDNALAAPQAGIAPPTTPGLSGIPDFASKLGAAAGASGRRLIGNPALLGPAGAGLARSLAPTLRDPTSFVRDQPEELSPMNVPVPDVQPVKQLDPRLSSLQQVGRQGVGTGQNPLAASRDRFLSAESNLVGDLDAEKDLELRKGDEQVQAVKEKAFGEQIMAAMQTRDAQLQAAEEATAQKRHEEFLAKNQQMADEIGKQKIDTHRLFRDKGTGEQIMFVIGGALGGMLQGLQGGQNDFLARAERMMDRDIAAQEKEIDNKKASLNARTSIFNQMLQQHGDRRLASQQAKNMMLEAMKLDLKARAAVASTPEMKTNAELAANAVQGRQDKLTTDIAQRSYQNEMAAANARAAAVKAAEEKQWQRGIELAKLGLEGDKLKIELAKAEREGRKEDAEQLRALSKEMADPATIQNKVAVENAYKRLQDKEGNIDATKGLPGVGKSADLREKFFGRPTGLNQANPTAWALNKAFGLDEQERVSRQDWNQLKLGYRHLVTGSGGGEKELAEIAAAFEGANTPQEQANAVQKLHDTVKRLEDTKRAGFDPAVVREFDAKMAGSGSAGRAPSTRIKK